MKPFPPIGYSAYLKTRELLELQKPRSDQFGHPAHDEMLFIITHQTYELWFKQILTELDSVLEALGGPQIQEVEMGTAVARLSRICEIQKLLVQQISVLETMTPLDFLDFRDFLFPASGFQSLQNRLIENKLGLKTESRLTFNAESYRTSIAKDEIDTLLRSESEPSLFDLVERWLARTPFLKTDDFDFWQHYQKAVETLFQEDLETIRRHPALTAEEKQKTASEVAKSQEIFQALFDEKKYADLGTKGSFRISYAALHAVLLIQLYRDQPALSLPFQLISRLQDIDELMATWRYRHALMAQRMIGRKIGTGGSSGSQYLKDATDRHRVFTDLVNLATFLIPRSRLPDLPAKIRETLGFHFTQTGTNR